MKIPNLFSLNYEVDNITTCTIRTVELFAGVGGFRIGLQNARFQGRNFGKVDLWELGKDSSEIIIKNDWHLAKQKIIDGYAHKLSEKYFNVIGSTKSS